MVNEFIQQWIIAHDHFLSTGIWEVTWYFDKFFTSEPYVDIVFWLFTACVIVINLVVAGYRLRNDR